MMVMVIMMAVAQLARSAQGEDLDAQPVLNVCKRFDDDDDDDDDMMMTMMVMVMMIAVAQLPRSRESLVEILFD